MTQSLHPITADRIDPDAGKVVRRLSRHGFEAYLVGGCVRDLLLGRTPKDFDVATDATPEQLKALFRNCRIIGRRFRLAHIVFGRKIIETATFRTTPPPQADGSAAMLLHDNEFGTAEEDAVRRDFTINGLFYDVVNNKVIDTVDGLNDLREGRLRTIGDPDLRLPEDPVRILRAVKFAARLDMILDEPTRTAMIRHRGLIADCSVARVLEEIYRLLRGGSAATAFKQLHELGILQVLFPEVSVLLPPPPCASAHEFVAVLRGGRPRPSQRGKPGQPGSQPIDDAPQPQGPPRVTEGLQEHEDPQAEEHGADHDLVEPAFGDTRLKSPDGDAPDPSDHGDLDDHSDPDPRGSPNGQIEPIDEHRRAVRLLRELGLGSPDARGAAATSLWGYLDALDRCVAHDRAPNEPVLLGALLVVLAELALRDDQRMSRTVELIDLLVKTVATRIHVSRRHRERLKQILVAQRRLEQRRRKRSLKEREYFSEARLLLRIRQEVHGSGSLQVSPDDSQPPASDGRRRRRGRRRGGRRGTRTSQTSANSPETPSS